MANVITAAQKKEIHDSDPENRLPNSHKEFGKIPQKTPGYNIIYIYVHFHIWQTCRKTRVQVKCLIGKNPHD